MPKVSWVAAYGFCSKFCMLSSSAKNFKKLVKIWRSYREFKGGNFFLRHSVVKILWWEGILMGRHTVLDWTRQTNRLIQHELLAGETVLPANVGISAASFLCGLQSYLWHCTTISQSAPAICKVFNEVWVQRILCDDGWKWNHNSQVVDWVSEVHECSFEKNDIESLYTWKNITVGCDVDLTWQLARRKCHLSEKLCKFIILFGKTKKISGKLKYLALMHFCQKRRYCGEDFNSHVHFYQ